MTIHSHVPSEKNRIEPEVLVSVFVPLMVCGLVRYVPVQMNEDNGSLPIWNIPEIRFALERVGEWCCFHPHKLQDGVSQDLKQLIFVPQFSQR